MSHLTSFHLLLCAHICNDIERCHLQKPLKWFSILWPMKMMPDLNMSHAKMSNFVSIPLLGFTVVIKLGSFDFECHWNTLIFFDKERYDVKIEYVAWKNVWFCFISIVWVHFRNDFRLDYVLLNSVWFDWSFFVWVEFWQ